MRKNFSLLFNAIPFIIKRAMAVVVKRLTQPAVNRSFEGSIPFDRPNIEFIGLIPKEIMVSSLFCLRPIFAFFFVSLGSNRWILTIFLSFIKEARKRLIRLENERKTLDKYSLSIKNGAFWIQNIGQLYWRLGCILI